MPVKFGKLKESIFQRPSMLQRKGWHTSCENQDIDLICWPNLVRSLDSRMAVNAFSFPDNLVWAVLLDLLSKEIYIPSEESLRLLSCICDAAAMRTPWSLRMQYWADALLVNNLFYSRVGHPFWRRLSSLWLHNVKSCQEFFAAFQIHLSWTKYVIKFHFLQKELYLILYLGTEREK